MKKTTTFLFVLTGSLLLVACTSMNNPLMASLANAQMQKKQLSNGKTVFMNYNLAPTAAWNCQQVVAPQYYNWAELNVRGQGTINSLLM